MGYVDAHVHVWTDDLERYPLAAGYTRADMSPPAFTPEKLFEHCRPCGVDRVVLIQMSYYGFDNSYMLDTIARWPEVFRGVAIVDHMRSDCGDLLWQLRGRGVRGLRLYSRVGDAPTGFDEPQTRRLFAQAGELGLAICLLIDPPVLPAVAAATARHPETTFVVDHLARIGAGGTIEKAQVEALCALAAYPNCFVKVSAFYALGEGRAPYRDLVPMISRVVEAFGADRLMWATDCPFQVQKATYEDSLALVRDGLGLTSREREALLSRTAASLFFPD